MQTSDGDEQVSKKSTMNDTVIPIRRAGATMQVTETGRVKDRLAVRVLVHGPGDTAPLPMRVFLPARCATPTVGGLVVFGGLRVELREVERADAAGGAG